MEKQIETKLTETIKDLGGRAFKLQFIGVRGAPDRIILMPGARVFFAELKNGSAGRLRVGQKAMAKILDRLGFKVWIISNEVELQEFLLQLN